MKRELARLNHVLIPSTKSERDRYRNGRLGRRIRLLVRLFARLTREGRFLLFVATLAIAFALDVGRTEAHVLVFAVFSLLFASLLVTPAYRLAQVTTQLRAPRRVTVGEEIAVTIALRSDATKPYRAIRIERPLLPWDGQWAGEAPTLARAPPGGRAKRGSSGRASSRAASTTSTPSASRRSCRYGSRKGVRSAPTACASSWSRRSPASSR